MPAVHHPFGGSTPRKFGSKNGLSALSAFKRLNMTQLLAMALAVYALSTLTSMNCHLDRTTTKQAGKNGASHIPNKWYYALATAHNAPVDQVAAYISSWGRHSPTTRLVIFTSPDLLQNPKIKQIYTEFKVDGIPFTPPPELDDPEDEEEFAKVGRQAIHRLQAYKEFVENKVGIIRAALLIAAADDVIIQKDPWEHPMVKSVIRDGGVLSTAEGGPVLGDVLLKDDAAYNRTLVDCFGRGSAAPMLKRTIANADAIFAGPTAAMHYLREMVDIATTRVRYKCMRNKRIDAAVHNYIVHDLALDPRLLDFGVWNVTRDKSPIFTAASGMPATVDGHGKLHRSEDEPSNEKESGVSIVVQYSSHPKLIRHFVRMYSYSPFRLDFAQEGSSEGLLDVSENWEENSDDGKSSVDSNKAEQVVRRGRGNSKMLEEEEEDLGVERKQARKSLRNPQQ